MQNLDLQSFRYTASCQKCFSSQYFPLVYGGVNNHTEFLAGDISSGIILLGGYTFDQGLSTQGTAILVSYNMDATIQFSKSIESTPSYDYVSLIRKIDTNAFIVLSGFNQNSQLITLLNLSTLSLGSATIVSDQLSPLLGSNFLSINSGSQIRVSYVNTQGMLNFISIDLFAANNKPINVQSPFQFNCSRMTQIFYTTDTNNIVMVIGFQSVEPDGTKYIRIATTSLYYSELYSLYEAQYTQDLQLSQRSLITYPNTPSNQSVQFLFDGPRMAIVNAYFNYSFSRFVPQSVAFIDANLEMKVLWAFSQNSGNRMSGFGVSSTKVKYYFNLYLDQWKLAYIRIYDLWWDADFYAFLVTGTSYVMSSQSYQSKAFNQTFPYKVGILYSVSGTIIPVCSPSNSQLNLYIPSPTFILQFNLTQKSLANVTFSTTNVSATFQNASFQLYNLNPSQVSLNSQCNINSTLQLKSQTYSYTQIKYYIGQPTLTLSFANIQVYTDCLDSVYALRLDTNSSFPISVIKTFQNTSSSIYVQIYSTSKSDVGTFQLNLVVTNQINLTYIYYLNISLIDNCSIAFISTPSPQQNYTYFINQGVATYQMPQFTTNYSSECTNFIYQVLSSGSQVPSDFIQASNQQISSSVVLSVNTTLLSLYNMTLVFDLQGYLNGYASNSKLRSFSLKFTVNCSYDTAINQGSINVSSLYKLGSNQSYSIGPFTSYLAAQCSYAITFKIISLFQSSNGYNFSIDNTNQIIFIQSSVLYSTTFSIEIQSYISNVLQQASQQINIDVFVPCYEAICAQQKR